MGNLGHMYEFGLGVEQNDALAVEWYQKAVDNGCLWAMRNLGSLYVYTLKDYNKGEEILLKAADAGETWAYISLANLYLYNNPKDYKKAEQWLLKAVDAGNAYAYTMLGDYYYGAGGWPRSDINKAIEWYAKAIELEDPNPYGFYRLGKIYYKGDGVKADYQQTLEYFSRAIEIWTERNDGYAYLADMYEILGSMYLSGRGVEKDREKGQEYYALSEEARNAAHS